MIRFENVTKVYASGHRPALEAVSLNVERGEFVFVVGASGSGKSTMLRLVLREEPVTSGSVLVAGKDLGRLPYRKVPAHRRQIGVVFQDFRLLPDRTVAENVAFSLAVIGKPRHTIAKVVPETLDLVGLGGKEKRFPHELSGGEQQRVAIARAFVNRPAILLADEPTGNLDSANSRRAFELLQRIVQEERKALLLVTHNPEIAEACDWIHEMQDGLVVGSHPRGRR